MAQPKESRKEQLDPQLRTLLDHIACELAQEYVRLMESAADEETELRQAAGGDA